MMTFDNLLNLKVSAALARIQVGIERSAYDALTAMGSNAPTLVKSLGLLRHAETSQASKEAELHEAQHQYNECVNSGIEPFNTEKWEQACKSSVMALGVGSLVYKRRDQLDCWFGECSSLMSGRFKLEGRRIFHAVKAEALGIRPFNPELFEKSCGAASEEAANGCGQSDVLWSQRATSLIDNLLAQVDDAFLAQAKQIAKCWGWMDDEAIKSMEDMINDDGLCCHGLDPDCCPAGCGDRDI